MDIFEDIQWRGLLSDYTRFADSDNADKAPTAARPAQWQEAQHFTAASTPRRTRCMSAAWSRCSACAGSSWPGIIRIAVAGGATGSIGDPSGKSAERNLLTSEQIKANVEAIKPQLARLLDFDAKDNPARLVDNASWFAPISFIDFLRDVGKHFTVNQMVGQGIRARPHGERRGHQLHSSSVTCCSRRMTFTIWPSSSAASCKSVAATSRAISPQGSTSCARSCASKATGLTLPLITKSDGTKFGKTESGTIWLDAKRTSVYQFYQFWINADDRDVLKYLRYFTLLPKEQIEALDAAHAADPGRREAHRALAREMTTLIHGEAACEAAIQAAAILFGGAVEDITAETLAILRAEVPAATITAEQLTAGFGIADALVAAKLTQSKGQARKDIEGGGVYINGQRVADISRTLTTADLLHGEGVLLRKGKRAYAVVSVG